MTARTKPAAMSTSDDDEDDGDGTTAPSWPAAEQFTSRLATQEALAGLRAKYAIPEPWALNAAAGAACSPPASPASCVVYAGALEAGMRLPLHPFFADALAHFGIAPSQLAPNGWRVMAGFVVLCHFRGVAGGPLFPFFRHLFALQALPKERGWYSFAARKGAAGALFTGLPSSIKGWKEEFLEVTAPAGESWRCPVRWGCPAKQAMAEPVLTEQEAAVARKLLHGQGVVDLRTYLCESNLVAAKISRAAAMGRLTKAQVLKAAKRKVAGQEFSAAGSSKRPKKPPEQGKSDARAPHPGVSSEAAAPIAAVPISAVPSRFEGSPSAGVATGGPGGEIGSLACCPYTDGPGRGKAASASLGDQELVHEVSLLLKRGDLVSDLREGSVLEASTSALFQTCVKVGLSNFIPRRASIPVAN